MDDILFHKEQHIGIVTLNRPKAYHALNLPMILALQAQLLAWEKDADVHAVIVRATDSKAFCAGGDVRWLYETGRKDIKKTLSFFWHEYRLNDYISRYPKPYIALMDGITMGGGVGISLHGAFPIATEHFSFAMPETTIGFFPDVGASYLLNRCPHESGVYLGLTGKHLSASQAAHLGLVKYSLLSHQQQDFIQQMLSFDLSNGAHQKIASYLRSNNAITPELMVDDEFIRQVFQYDDMESIINALESLGDSSWAKETRLTLSKKSPLSLKITLAQLRHVKNHTLADCLKLDYQLVAHFMNSHDFYEGVRALLIDKDNHPSWVPDSLKAVTSDKVAHYFEEAAVLQFI